MGASEVGRPVLRSFGYKKFPVDWATEDFLFCSGGKRRGMIPWPLPGVGLRYKINVKKMPLRFTPRDEG